MHHVRHPAVFTFALVLVTLIAFASFARGASANGNLPDSDYPELFSWPGTPEEVGLPRFVGSEAAAKPLSPIFIPPNDFLAEQGRNSLHGDNYNSDTLNYEAPLGIDPVISSRQLGLLAATCPTVVFDLHGNVVTICIGVARVRLFLMDPHTLEVLAEQELPLRAWVAAGRPEDITTVSSGGGYFHVDQFGRALVGVANQRIQRWEAIQVKKKSWEWQLVDDYDLTPVLNNPDAPLQDAIPDYTGRLWFTTQPGIIGYLDENTGKFETLELGEFLQNGFAIDTDGAIYAVTVEALYRLSVNAEGSIVIDWETGYDNDGGQGGLLSAGSGTTPTLFGDENDLIAIADNSAGQIHINVYHRQDGRQICEFAMFQQDASATENSPIGYGNDLVLENNAGYPGPFGEPFLGFIPTYGWYFGALDWETGERVYEVWVGNGSFWNNVLDPVTLGPDGTAYVGTKNGLMSIRDGKKKGRKN